MNNDVLTASFFYGIDSSRGYSDRDLILHAKDFSLKGEKRASYFRKVHGDEIARNDKGNKLV